MNPEIITLSDASGAQADLIPEFGAWLFSYRIQRQNGKGMREILYSNKSLIDTWPAKIHCGNPLLFPQAGPCSKSGTAELYAVQGKEFSLMQHGFARRMPWSVIHRDSSSIHMHLKDDKSSYATFPFHFELDLKYRLELGNLLWSFSITNKSKVTMPFSSGFHPFFRLSSTESHATISVPAGDHAAQNPTIENWNLTPSQALTVSSGEDLSGTLIHTHIDPSDRKASLHDPGDDLSLEIDFTQAPGFDTLAVWAASPTMPYICIEPWSALPNALNSGNGLISLLPNASWKGKFAINILN